MAVPRADFHVTTVAPNSGETTRPQFDEMWRPQSGGGGLPWFGRPSPTVPNNPGGYENPAPVEPYETQGPPAPEGGGLGGMFAGMSAKDLAALLGVLASTVGAMKTNGGTNTAPSSATTDPQMQELIALMSGRLKKSEPMFDSVQAMTNGLLPTAYQNGGRGNG